MRYKLFPGEATCFSDFSFRNGSSTLIFNLIFYGLCLKTLLVALNVSVVHLILFQHSIFSIFFSVYMLCIFPDFGLMSVGLCLMYTYVHIYIPWIH